MTVGERMSCGIACADTNPVWLAYIPRQSIFTKEPFTDPIIHLERDTRKKQLTSSGRVYCLHHLPMPASVRRLAIYRVYGNPYFQLYSDPTITLK